jgi:uncharacterized membrane protein HdeD (DUF308 family)/alpha-beta hydrolase superfamily lysophospholipase
MSLARIAARFDRRARLAIGVFCVAVGVALTLRPFASLHVLVVFVALSCAATGLSDLLGAREAHRPMLGVATGIGWLVAAIIVIAWAGITIHALAVVAGVILLVSGLGRLIQGVRGGKAGRLIALLTGLTNVVLGILALSWPDVTVLVVALLFGPAVVLFGLGRIAAALTGGGIAAPVGRSWAPLPPWLQVAGATIALVFAFGLLGLSAAIHRSTATPDSFYTPPAHLPARSGVLLREQPYSAGLPNAARAWRILYTTTRDTGTPAVASAVVIASRRAPPGPRPVIAWAHGTTGVATRCAPSLLASRWNADVIPALNRVIARGWVLVATDYVGLGTPGPHPFLIGQGEARSVLDSVRAANQMPQISLLNDVVVWGHSQGGHAALWTGMMAPSYAPDLKIAGIAALAPASDLVTLVKEVKDSLEGKIIAAYILNAYSRIYPDVSFNAYVRPAARVIVRETARRCLDLPEALVSGATKILAREQPYAEDPLKGALGRRLAENVPTGRIRAPVLIAQGRSDPLVPPSMQATYVRKRCAAGQRLAYLTYGGRDHLSLLAPGSTLIRDLLSWTQARLSDRREAAGCYSARR